MAKRDPDLITVNGFIMGSIIDLEAKNERFLTQEEFMSNYGKIAIAKKAIENIAKKLEKAAN